MQSLHDGRCLTSLQGTVKRSFSFVIHCAGGSWDAPKGLEGTLEAVVVICGVDVRWWNTSTVPRAMAAISKAPSRPYNQNSITSPAFSAVMRVWAKISFKLFGSGRPLAPENRCVQHCRSPCSLGTPGSLRRRSEEVSCVHGKFRTACSFHSWRSLGLGAEPHECPPSKNTDFINASPCVPNVALATRDAAAKINHP